VLWRTGGKLPPPPAKPDPVRDIVAALPLRQKIAQVMIASEGPGTPPSGARIQFRKHVGRLAAQAAAGRRPTCAKELRAAGYRIRDFCAADFEGGLIDHSSHFGFEPLPAPEELGRMWARGDIPGIQAAGRRLARTAAALGINMVLAPVLDLRSLPEGGAGIDMGRWEKGKSLTSERTAAENSRRISADPATVHRVAELYLRAARAEAARLGAPLAVVAKHFPGERAPVNSDFAQVVETLTAGQLAAGIEIYDKLAEDGLIHGAMLSNNGFLIRGKDGRPSRIDGTPAGLSAVVAGLAHPDLLLMSDDQGLPRFAQHGEDPAKRMRRAFRAKLDLLMICDDGAARRRLADDLQAMVEEEPELGAELERKAARVLALKLRLGLIGR